MKPLALDLCCGKGGWTRGLLAAGWDVIGVDIENQDDYPPTYFFQMDVRKIHKSAIHKLLRIFEGRKISLVVASPPCKDYSYRHLPFGRVKNLPPPDKSIWLACERIAQICNAPLVLENVIGAQMFMGKARAHYGYFYLWGDVPALLPIGNPQKGFGHDFRGRTKSKQRKEWSAAVAVIPFELAYWVGQCFNRSEEKCKLK